MSSVVLRPDGTSIHYEVFGTGTPLLALAPGIANSSIMSWKTAFLDPVTAFADDYMVVAMDQRCAGQSTGGLAPFSYTQAAADQVAVLDALGVDACAVLGESFGCTYALRLATQCPDRVKAVTCVRPTGLSPSNSIGSFLGLFSETIRYARAFGMDAVVDAATAAAPLEDNRAAGPFGHRVATDPILRDQLAQLPVERYIALIVRFAQALWPEGNPFFSVSTQMLGKCGASVLIIPGPVDERHPSDLTDELWRLVPNGTRLPPGWTAGIDSARAAEAVRDFLRLNMVR
ncbi:MULTISPECIES: alpha/beta fold hydrolase [Mycobacterium]|uniref:alpha/beta fold hydrolase n=1 Tax=Mycobacterium TaxID=1763 RepID=UPI00200F7589|nr:MULTISPECIES: alpha/beta hydrolase [Mycobacterium]UQB93103.1 alpha/beta hydrolase [Mycobacterium intracellulare]WSE46180.1 alpha/beta hydrolase [Mycobacterium sp. 3-98]